MRETKSLYSRFDREKCMLLREIGRIAFYTVIAILFAITLVSLTSSSYSGIQRYYYYHLCLVSINFIVILIHAMSMIRQRHGDGQVFRIPTLFILFCQCVTLVLGFYSLGASGDGKTSQQPSANILTLTIFDVIFFGAVFVRSLYKETYRYLYPTRNSRRMYALAATQDLEIDDDLDFDSLYIDDSDNSYGYDVNVKWDDVNTNDFGNNPMPSTTSLENSRLPRNGK